ncbi:MAG: sulfoxide reductase heme-binding subunit YedZ [Proteobacteria bacterium]|nr:sulfoxide reductase heme-binding subunit YedZ [Candidatus Fonsibacter sp. PEL3]NBV93472.1 sulfoxide reductase heme-binding subunit YedZ [Candidatus Fonsibacter sp. PEL4]
MNIILVKRIVFVLGLIPLLRLFILGYLGDLTANPIEFITRSTGTWTITFLCMTLAMSPLRWITGFSQWVQLRKTLGLFTFFYGFLHFTIWYWLDHNLNFLAMISDVIKRPFIAMGFIAFVIMSLLAMTSNQTAMRLLGGKWKMLHRFIYLIAILAVIHYFWHKEGKRDFTVVYIYTGIIFSLLFIRIPWIKRFIQK